MLYEMKITNKKKQEPTATEKGRGFNNCPTPQPQKANELITEKK